MPSRLSVLVTGATGNQGGAVARLLLSRGHRVRGLTRKPESAAARKLKALGAEIATGDMEDRGSLAYAASGMDAFFCVSTPFDSGGPATDRGASSTAAVPPSAGDSIWRLPPI
jgi:uncharacterized protein YbjT (DUF2867 family)